MKSAKMVALVAVLALSLAPMAMATPIVNSPWAPNVPSHTAEHNLYYVYNTLYGTGYGTSQALANAQNVSINSIYNNGVFNLSGGSITLQVEARYAGYTENWGYYTNTGTGAGKVPEQLIQNPNSGFPLPSPPPPVTISPAGNFGLYDLANGASNWYSQAGLNLNTENHMLMLATPNPNVFLLAFEDMPFALSDRDYNDLVIQLTYTPSRIVPEPTSMALLGLGLAGMVVRKVRSRKAA